MGNYIMSWVEHIKKTQKKGESYKDAMKRASATWTKKEKVVKKADVSLKKTLKNDIKKKDPKEPKKEKKPRKVKIVEPTSVKEVESIVNE